MPKFILPAYAFGTLLGSLVSGLLGFSVLPGIIANVLVGLAEINE